MLETNKLYFIIIMLTGIIFIYDMNKNNQSFIIISSCN